MNIMAEFVVIFGVCLVSEGIAALLPVAFPASVIALLLLGLLLFTRIIKPEHIQRLSGFLVANMAFFFLRGGDGARSGGPAAVGPLSAHQLSHHTAGLSRHRLDRSVADSPLQRKGGRERCLTPC